jgi:glucokinase
VAADAQLKFLRFGISTAIYTDSRVQLLAAKVLRPGDVVVIVSSSGKIAELLTVADTAHERGATVLAITAGSSPLARKADVALIVDHVEDVDTQMPMISRILHLLVVDILAVGVAMRRHGPAVADGSGAALDEESAADVQDARQRVVSGPVSLAKLTTHSR